MKICLYLEFRTFLGGRLFRNIGTGLLSSYENQKQILRLLKIPFSESSNIDGDILQINTPWLRSIIVMKRARKRGIPVMVWAHVTAEDAKGVFRFSSYVIPALKKYLRYAYGLADVVLCPTAYTRGLLLNYGLSAEKLRIQSNAVQVSRYERDENKRKTGRERYGIADQFVAGSVGLVIPRKGVNTFLLLAESFPSVPFFWFGKQYSSLLAKSLPKKLPANVRFTGYVPDIQEAYSMLDAFIFPSFEENEGMAILEAAASGLPIIVRDIPTYQGWLQDGHNCLKASSDEDFRNALRKLQEDSELRRKLGIQAKQLAREFSIEEAGKRMETMYEELLERSRQ